MVSDTRCPYLWIAAAEAAAARRNISLSIRYIFLDKWHHEIMENWSKIDFYRGRKMKKGHYSLLFFIILLLL